MRANPAEFELVSRGTLGAVLELLAAEPGAWTPIAGGTEVMVAFAAGRLRERRFVNIYGLPELTAIDTRENAIVIGAGATYSALRGHAGVAGHLPLLARAASWTGSIANQNRGTLGGNLVNGSPAADSPPALLVYDAVLEVVCAAGTRRVACADFFTGYKRNTLRPGELLRAIHVPLPAPGTRQYLRKVGARQAQAVSKLALAATARLEGETIADARIALASVAHAPVRAHATETMLRGRPLGPQLVAEARRTLSEEIAPLDDIRSTARYRTQVAANLLAEFLESLAPA